MDTEYITVHIPVGDSPLVSGLDGDITHTADAIGEQGVTITDTDMDIIMDTDMVTIVDMRGVLEPVMLPDQETQIEMYITTEIQV